MNQKPNFDIVRFYEDVISYGTKYGMGPADIARAVGSKPATLSSNMTQSILTLQFACKLADFADLSLDKYRGPSEFTTGPTEKFNNVRPTIANLSARMYQLEKRVEEWENGKNT